MRVLPVDHFTARAHGIHIATFDLADKQQVDRLLELLEQEKDNLVWIHFAPACGTASRARERPLPKLEAQGFRVAKPLRSLQHPEGVPGLKGTDKQRVEAANLVYFYTAVIVRWAVERCIACSIENPQNSLFWFVPCIRKLLSDIPGYDCCFDNCCHGGSRKKTTRWWSTRNWFQPLAVFCDDGHPHAPWKPTAIEGKLVYPTAQEAAYPILLCQRLAGIVKAKLLEFGAVDVQSLIEQQAVSEQTMHRFVLDLLPRGRKYKPLVSLLLVSRFQVGWSRLESFKRPQYSVESLKVLAKGLNASILSQLENADDSDETNQQAWKQTLDEIQKGYVWVDDSADPCRHALAKRFGLNQKSKVRVIDDCTIGGLNKTIGVVEKYKIHAMDEISAYLAWALTRCEFSDVPSFNLLGRTFDLKAAYKQFGISSNDRDLLRIAVRDTDQGLVRYLGVNSLPFGAVGSVGGFLRISLAVWFLGLVGLRLAWCAYFDDYTVFAKQCMSSNAKAAAEGLFQLLGLEFATDGTKACEFSQVFRTLGVKIDLSRFAAGEVLLGHTQERKRELQEVLEEILGCGFVSSKQSESLRGRLHWFESFAFGRIANQAIKVLGDLALKENRRNVLSDHEKRALSFLLQRVANASPLRLSPTSLNSWTVFTDGACEGMEVKVGTVGGVLFAPGGRCESFFGDEVPRDLMEKFSSVSANPIYELEIVPILIAFALWRNRFSGASVVFYIDNDAARSACIKAMGATGHASLLMNRISRLEMERQCKAWYARVPTSSNIADRPSRLCFDQVVALGAGKIEVQWTEVAEALGVGSVGLFP